jgi:hypothetical protein
MGKRLALKLLSADLLRSVLHPQWAQYEKDGDTTYGSQDQRQRYI